MKMEKEKKIVVLIVSILGLLVIIQSKGNAQDFKLTTYFENTSVSPKAGSSAGYRIDTGFEAGLFYQKEITPGFEERDDKIREQEFFGFYFSMPVMNKRKFGLDLMVRSGSVNNESFTITPSVHLSYRPLPFMGISAGMGVRCLRPTIIPKLEIIF